MTRRKTRYVVRYKVRGKWHDSSYMTSEEVARLTARAARREKFPVKIETWELTRVAEFKDG